MTTTLSLSLLPDVCKRSAKSGHGENLSCLCLASEVADWNKTLLDETAEQLSNLMKEEK